jgi:UDP-glucose 6-dehydrogenase
MARDIGFANDDAVFGLGYVRLVDAVLLAHHNGVTVVDITQVRVDPVNAHKSPVIDSELQEFLATRPFNLIATFETLAKADYVTTPTNYDVNPYKSDRTSVDAMIVAAKATNPTAIIVIESTIPVGFIGDARQRLGADQLIAGPEFLRESRALHDNLHASRVIDGVSLNPRMGRYYKNPSFGYAGYCLLQDTKQLLANYLKLLKNFIHAVVEGNITRKNFLSDQIIANRMTGVLEDVKKKVSPAIGLGRTEHDADVRQLHAIKIANLAVVLLRQLHGAADQGVYS